MREYDDHVRLHTPLLRRIIVLLVVLAAVPIILWSITAFVRTYVAQPKVPTFRSLATAKLIEPPTGSLAAPAATDPPDSAADQATPSDAPAIVEARATATDAGAQAAAAPGAQATIAPMPAPALQVVRPGTPAMAAAPTDSGGPVAWPDAPGSNPNLGSGKGSLSSQQPSDVSERADADDGPAAKPIAGPIPLPRHRPRLFAMVQGGVPVPRPRPATAAAAEPTPSAPVEAPMRDFTAR